MMTAIDGAGVGGACCTYGSDRDGILNAAYDAAAEPSSSNRYIMAQKLLALPLWMP